MSVSRVLIGLGAVGIMASAMGCKVEASVKTKTRFTEANVVQTDSADWAGQEIEINIQGVGASFNGGVNVTADPNTTKVNANARLLAMAFEDEKANADQTIVDVKNTYKITNDGNKITVACGHGNSYGSSASGESGCELINISIPVGSAQQPLKLTVLGGNGPMTVQLRSATIIALGANNGGDISVELPSSNAAMVGAEVSLVSPKADDIAVTLPSDWAADEVLLQADADKISNAFSDAKIGQGAGGRGTPGTGLKLLKLTSENFAGSTGTVTLR